MNSDNLLEQMKNVHDQLRSDNKKTMAETIDAAIETIKKLRSYNSTSFIKCDYCDEAAEYHYCTECMNYHRD